MFAAELERVDDKLDGWLWWKAVGLLRDVFLKNVVLNRATQLLPIDALLLGNDEVHRPKNGSRCIRRHRRADLIKRNTFEERFHVGERIDRHAAFTNLAHRHRVIRVVSHQSWKMKRDG